MFKAISIDQSNRVRVALITGIGLLLGLAVYASPTVGATNHTGGGLDVAGSVCTGAQFELGDPDLDKCDNQQATSTLNQALERGLNVFSVIVGAVAVVMVILGGFRYVVSGGSEAGVKSAKNTILYALIGLVFVLLAQAIVNFVLVQFT